MSVREYVKQLTIRSGETHRGMCPVCAGSNTFTATNANGNIKYNCYKASCDVAGTAYKGASLDDLARSLTLVPSPIDRRPVVFSEPECFISPEDVEVTRTFMARYSLCKPYYDGRIALRYDCKLNRLAFLITDTLTGVTVDAVGRALEPGVKPKWLRYGKSKDAVFLVRPESTVQSIGFNSIGPEETAVIVEDCVSACTISAIAVGIGILGTNLPSTLNVLLKAIGIRRVIVALDPDAAAKSIDIQRELCYYFDTKVWLIKDDLKYYTRGRLIEEVGGLLT